MRKLLLLSAGLLCAASVQADKEARPNDAPADDDLARGAALFRAAYDAGHREAPILLGLARASLWQNHLDGAEKFARAINAAAPEAKGAAAVEKIASLRRGDSAPGVYVGLPNETKTISFVARDPLPTLVGKINGHEAGLLIDTGADQLVLDKQFAQELKISAAASGQGTFAGGKTAAVAQGMADTIDLGELHLAHVPVTILPTRQLDGFARRVDGIIGTRFLAKFRATIDYPHARLVLAPRQSKVVPQPSSFTLPLWWVGDHFLYAGGLLNGKDLGLWLVDTGLAGGGLMVWNRGVLNGASIQLDDKTTTGQGGGGSVTATDFTAAKFQLGAAEVHNVPGKFLPGSPLSASPPFRVAGIVSHEFLKRWAVTFDLDRMQLVLGP